MKRLLILAALLVAGCSSGMKITHERMSPEGKVICRTEVTAAEDKANVALARRSVTVGEDCKANVNFGSTEENAGDQVQKAINAVLGGVAPLLKQGVAK